MTNLNSYTIDNHLYTVGNEYIIGPDTLKINTIVNIADTVFFFCNKTTGNFTIRLTNTTSMACEIIPINAILFHNRVLETVQSSGN